jgi:hypothetical protein
MSVLQKIKQAWFGLRDWRDRQGVVTEAVGAARIIWNPRHLIYVRAYYGYCVDLFRAQLVHTPAPLHLLFGDYAAPDVKPLRLHRIGFQIEHTLVVPGGDDSAGAPMSQTPLLDTPGHYLARLVQPEQFVDCDLVVDYSAANIAHLRTATGFERHLACTITLAPLLFAPKFDAPKRHPGAVTLFSDATSGRRAQFLDRALSHGLDIRNIKRSFTVQRLQRVFHRSRILVNVHRTDHHHTLEELRVLPALLCGVLVISEEVPLKAHIPYARFIIWSRFEDLPQTIARVEADYAMWHARIFSDPELAVVLAHMQEANRAAVAAVVRDWANTSVP